MKQLPAILLTIALLFCIRTSYISAQYISAQQSKLLSGIIQIDADGAHNCALTELHTVKCWGYNGFGQLGNGTTKDASIPVAVTALQDPIAKISLGSRHTCALAQLGKVFCWGDGREGQLGSGRWISNEIPGEVIGLPQKIVEIDAGGAHTCALTAGGRVLCWGMNFSGQLGNGTDVGHSRPIDVVGLAEKVTMIATGDLHTCVLTVKAEVYCWGDNQFGQLGDGTRINRNIPVKVTDLSEGAIFVTSGYSQTCAVTKTRRVKCWGGNGYWTPVTNAFGSNQSTTSNLGQVSIGVTRITLGLSHICVLTERESVLCWGRNDYGQLGTGWVEVHDSPTPVKTLGSGVLSISSGDHHTCALMNTHTVRCWGEYANGQLGDGVSGGNDRAFPQKVIGLPGKVLKIASGSYHSCALMEDHSVMCWGIYSFNDPFKGSISLRAIPTAIQELEKNVSSIAVGGTQTCILTMEHVVKCWDITTPTTTISPQTVEGLDKDVTSIASGADHTCALLVDRSVHCWGVDNAEQLGNGTTINRYKPVEVLSLRNKVVTIAAGYSTTCAITIQSSVMCWGAFQGKLQTTPLEVPGFSDGAKAVAIGLDHICVLILNGTVRCFGRNWLGPLGDGTEIDRDFPVAVLRLDGGVTAIGAGERFTCALTDSGKIACWGQNTFGQLGAGPMIHQRKPVFTGNVGNDFVDLSVGHHHTCAVDRQGIAYCWGSNGNGQLGWHQLYSPVDVMQ